MKKYTFEELNDLEFEDFVNDVLTQANGWSIERFKPGSDGGIDGRASSANGNIVIQSKHFRKSGIEKLLSEISKNEAKKALKLAPDRYVFATSLNLNPNDKKKILSAFSGVNIAESDILGNDELNALLREHGKVLKTWYKLWAENAETLELFLHPEIRSKEIALKARLNKINKIFVETEDIEPALRSLNDDHVVVLSGEPGVGKTTLAEYLCQVHMKEGYSVDVIEGEVTSHPFNFADREQKTIYYFDDFLGSNYFSAISGNQDSSITRLIEQIKIEPNKRLILTSRSNIINKAEIMSQSFRSFGLTKRQYIVRINRYSKLTKAKMLYNHFWHSELAEENKLEIVANDFYDKIINHRNFNPRLIAFSMTSESLVEKSLSKSVYRHLENPEQIWDHCYTVQLDEQARILVKLCVAAGGKISEAPLEIAYERALREFGFVPTTNQPQDFAHTVKLVCNSLLTRYIGDDDIFYTHYNPSVSDFVIGKISCYSEARRLINCLDSPNVVIFYRDLIKFKKVRRNESELISEYLLGKYGSQVGNKFIAALDLALWLEKDTEPLRDAITIFNGLQLVSGVGYATDMLSNILGRGYTFGIDLATYSRMINAGIFDHDELCYIYNQIEDEDRFAQVLSLAKEKLVESLAGSIEDIVSDSDGLYECGSLEEIDSFADSVIDRLGYNYGMLTPADLTDLKGGISISSLSEKIESRMGDYDEPVERPVSSRPAVRTLSEQDIIHDMFRNYQK